MPRSARTTSRRPRPKSNIPTGTWTSDTIAGYIARFTALNHLAPSTFTIRGKEVVA